MIPRAGGEGGLSSLDELESREVVVRPPRGFNQGWAEWRELGDVPPTGAGVTIKSSTGRTLASAEQGLGGARFHC